MFICATAFSVTACSNSNSFSDPIDFETPSEVPNPIPTQGTAKTFTTTADGTYSLAEGETKLFDGVSMAPTTIEIDKIRNSRLSMVSDMPSPTLLATISCR